MDDVFYIPFVYIDDAVYWSAHDLLEARADCLEWFNSVHPEAFIAVGPIFNLDKNLSHALIVDCVTP